MLKVESIFSYFEKYFLQCDGSSLVPWLLCQNEQYFLSVIDNLLNFGSSRLSTRLDFFCFHAGHLLRNLIFDFYGFECFDISLPQHFNPFRHIVVIVLAVISDSQSILVLFKEHVWLVKASPLQLSLNLCLHLESALEPPV